VSRRGGSVKKYRAGLLCVCKPNLQGGLRDIRDFYCVGRWAAKNKAGSTGVITGLIRRSVYSSRGCEAIFLIFTNIPSRCERVVGW
jgi:hypothetical protein